MNTPLSQPAHWFRFNLRSLLLLFVFLALGLTALKLATSGWTAATVTISTGVLFFALLGWIHGRESRRAFWSGFAVCGWGYLALVYIWGGFFHAPSIQTASTASLDFLFRCFNPACEQFFPPGQPILNSQNQLVSGMNANGPFYYPVQSPTVYPYSYNINSSSPTYSSPQITPPPPQGNRTSKPLFIWPKFLKLCC